MGIMRNYIDANLPKMIGIDWGTTSFRAYLIGISGNILDLIDSRIDLSNSDHKRIEELLLGKLKKWQDLLPRLPIIASGMIGSRQGWIEAPYLSCPVRASDLGKALVRVPSSLEMYIVPGLSILNSVGVPDVMRGEETQILGVMCDNLNAGPILILPGTHSKWVHYRNGFITDFATFMTGELYAALKDHTILAQTTVDSGLDEKEFSRGLDYGLESSSMSGGVLQKIFSTRTLVLFDSLKIGSGSSYLSGLLIGCEMREAADFLTKSDVEISEAAVIGRSELTNLYRLALEKIKINPILPKTNAAAKGQWVIAKEAGLLGD